MGGASLALASDTTVMSIGGFTGSDPAPTLEQFQAYVAAGDVHYFVVGGGPGGGMFGRAGAGRSERRTGRHAGVGRARRQQLGDQHLGAGALHRPPRSAAARSTT